MVSSSSGPEKHFVAVDCECYRNPVGLQGISALRIVMTQPEEYHRLPMSNRFSGLW